MTQDNFPTCLSVLSKALGLTYQHARFLVRFLFFLWIPMNYIHTGRYHMPFFKEKEPEKGFQIKLVLPLCLQMLECKLKQSMNMQLQAVWAQSVKGCALEGGRGDSLGWHILPMPLSTCELAEYIPIHPQQKLCYLGDQGKPYPCLFSSVLQMPSWRR